MTLLSNLLSLKDSLLSKLLPHKRKLLVVAAVAGITILAIGYSSCTTSCRKQAYTQQMAEIDAQRAQLKQEEARINEKLKEVDIKLDSAKAKEAELATTSAAIDVKLATLRTTIANLKPTIDAIKQKDVFHQYTGPIPVESRPTVDAVITTYAAALDVALQMSDDYKQLTEEQQEKIAVDALRITNLQDSLVLSESARALEASKTLTVSKDRDAVVSQLDLTKVELDKTSKSLDRTKTQRNYSLVGNAAFLVALLLL